jgi:hypothetical protein
MLLSLVGMIWLLFLAIHSSFPELYSRELAPTWGASDLILGWSRSTICVIYILSTIYTDLNSCDCYFDHFFLVYIQVFFSIIFSSADKISEGIRTYSRLVPMLIIYFIHALGSSYDFLRRFNIFKPLFSSGLFRFSLIWFRGACSISQDIRCHLRFVRTVQVCCFDAPRCSSVASERFDHYPAGLSKVSCIIFRAAGNIPEYIRACSR